MIEPLTADEEAALSQYHLGGPEQPSLLGRIGQQAANVPSDIFNDLSRLAFNVGIRSPDQTQAPEVAKPFDIAPPETTGQSVVDIGASLVRALPLILAGETAGAGVAELAGAAPTAAKIIGSAVGFGAQGLTESPEQAALQTSIGAGFRAADFLPLRYKLPLAGAIGALTGAESYAQDPNIEKAAGVGLINAALPFILKGRERGELATDRAEVPNAGQPMPAIYTERGGGPLTEIPSTVQPQGDLINPNRVTSSPRPRPVATLQSDFFPELFTPQETQPFLPFGAPCTQLQFHL